MKKDIIKKIRNKLGRFYVERIERIPYINWFNPLITIYLNFRSFPLRQAWRFPVFVFGWPKLFSLFGTMECVGKCKTGMIVLNQTNCGMPNHPGTSTVINNWGKILFHGKCQIFTGNKINVLRNGILELGEGVRIATMVIITAQEYVGIGEKTRIAHRCQVMDYDYHYIADFRRGIVRNYYRPIKIGDYCWICNSSTIAKGSVIPNKTIVASNSLVNKDMSDIPEESIIGGQPAKMIATGYRRVESKILYRKIWFYFKENPKATGFPLPEGVDHGICDVDE